MVKKLFVVFVLVVLSVALLAEGTKEKTADGKKVYEFKFAHVMSEADPAVMALYKFKERVEERSGGGLKLDIYHSGQFGDTPDMLEQVKSGSNIGCITDASRFDGSVPEFSILNAPYIYASYEDGVKVVKSDIAQRLYDELAEKSGYHVLSFNWWQGARNIITTNTPINSMSDLDGLRVRSPGSPLYMSLIGSWGAKPTGLAWNEIYSAMQTKVIDGAEGQISGLYSTRLYEVGSYMAVTHHIHLFSGLVMSEERFSELPMEYQKILTEESWNAGEEASKIAMDMASGMEEEMVAAGMTVTKPDIMVFKKASQKVYDSFPQFTEIKKEIDSLLGY